MILREKGANRDQYMLFGRVRKSREDFPQEVALIVRPTARC